MFCIKCGAKNPDNAKFCWNCGENLFDPGKNPKFKKPELKGENSENKQKIKAIAVIIAAVLFATAVVTTGIFLTPTSAEDLVLKNFDPNDSTEYAFGSQIRKDQVVSVEFLSELDSAPKDARDVSENGSNKVRFWAEPYEKDLFRVFIAGDGTVYAPQDCSRLFEGYSSMRTVEFSGVFNTINTVNMNRMFYFCSCLEVVDVEHLNTGNVTDMGWMFGECRSVEELDISQWDTGKVTCMSGLFHQCNSLQSLDLTGIDAGNVIELESMFARCRNLKSIDLSAFTNQNIKKKNFMFFQCNPDLEIITNNRGIVEQFDIDIK